jgi:DNA segregation ATPase FtsK/SpoIIIE-like protein
MELDVKKLPGPTKENLVLGRIAETKIKACLEPDKLKTHTIVAGATGGGKSIAAQVIIEEALIKNVAVIVFDPTAQWSGMLRKCDDRKMLSYYPAFGLKQTDARAFFGNIRQISHAREIIEIEKYIHPGQIQIFALNKLDPNDMDIFVASVIRQIFKSDPKETPDLKVLLVFDEVHRLLSKFGGNGEGFLQIERACREFRKWGIGVMLVSQVLSDFVGEIKANINTEVQMRTRDEGDLGRIKIKYGEEFLQSLVKASVGVGMFVNTAYNKGKPYFINFRPILHNTRRLSDEELEKYNKYNEIIDDFESQVDQLEKEKVDIFDLKMELKLIKDKLMTGNFSVVDIYIEGLGPRLQKQWEKIGKKPKKIEKKLIDVSEIQKSVEEAKKARAVYEKEEEKKKKPENSVAKQ